MAAFSHVTAWVFDLDETLYHPETGFAQFMGKKQMDCLCRMMGKEEVEVREITKSLREKYNAATFTGLYKDNVLDVHAFIEDAFDVNPSDFLTVDEQQAFMFARLSGKKAVFTNSPTKFAEITLEALGLTSHFDEIFAVERTNFNTKPMTESFELVLKALGGDPTTYVMVEDRLENLQKAKEFGMTTVYLHGESVGGMGAYVDYHFKDLNAFLAFAIKEL